MHAPAREWPLLLVSDALHAGASRLPPLGVWPHASQATASTLPPRARRTRRRVTCSRSSSAAAARWTSGTSRRRSSCRCSSRCGTCTLGRSTTATSSERARGPQTSGYCSLTITLATGASSCGVCHLAATLMCWPHTRARAPSANQPALARPSPACRPENMFLMRDGGLKLGDFGLAIDASIERPKSRVGTLGAPPLGGSTHGARVLRRVHGCMAPCQHGRARVPAPAT